MSHYFDTLMKTHPRPWRIATKKELDNLAWVYDNDDHVIKMFDKRLEYYWYAFVELVNNYIDSEK